MKLSLVLLIVGIHFITLTRQQSGLANLSVRKKCSHQQLEMRARLMEHYDQLCGITTTTTTTTSTTTTTTTTTTPCGVPDALLTTLKQLYSDVQKDHFYTNSSAEAALAENMYAYTPLASPGKIAIAQDCTCGATSLVPIYRLYSESQTNHFYTSSLSDVGIAVAFGYTLEEISWYCSPTKGLCGATEPLYAFNDEDNEDSIYVTDVSQLADLTVTYAGILCYIWPS